jgi:hypothetical protein
MSSATLPISRLIDVDVTLAPQAAQGQNLNSLLILSPYCSIDVVTRMREYTSIEEVTADPALASQDIAAATLFFEQNPQPISLFIGRWAKTASSGQLIGAPLPAAQQAIGFWNAITNGGVDLVVNGTAKNLTGLNFSGSSNLNGVAAVIQAALTGATIVWDADYQRFEVTSATTGPSSTVAFATAGAGTDISGDLGLTAASSGAYVANGIAAESALAAVELFDNNFGQIWYALTILNSVDADSIAVANYIEAGSNKHYFGVSTQESAVLTPGDTTDIAYMLQQLGLNHSCVQYSSTSPYSVCSLFGRILTTNYEGNNTVITLMYKQEPGIVPENLTETEIAALEAKNCNVFVAYNNDTAIIEQGVSSSGNFIDTVMGADALAVLIQTAIYNQLYTSPTKIPQTDAGVHILTTAIAAVCQQFVNNGYIAPGTWTSQGFGTLNTGDFIPSGYYIYAPPVATQAQAQRAARISVPIQIAVKLAGAIQTVDVSILVNS